ncbi:hypothetical protein [Metabacillus malikii]|uniref:Lipoprotein n=1 Tax=Metabacillus malikii TaxID=1504265 RepID=A0ABT9ZEL9_9BACI|nr:hypothetical protein [Metabacillus malikii]MDQ0230711.1 hypothetical protein [Metabacillus malikii]
MLKRTVILFLIIFTFTACANNQENDKTTTTKTDVNLEKVDLKDVDAIAAYFKDKGLPISDSRTYNEDDDPNELLGRPGGYIGKMDFIDKNVEKKLIETEKTEYNIPEDETKATMREKFGVSNGGSIEVFANQDDAKKRFEYVSQVASELGGMFTEYGYQEKNIYLRLSKSLTPTQADEYEKVLKELVN